MRQGAPATPEQGQGIPPNVMPPEMSMSPNPDQMRAMRNIPPSGVNRRRQTADERAAGKSGVLYSPSGEVIL